MEGNAIPISENTAVIIKVSGDLFLQGVEGNEVRFLNSEDRIRINQTNETLYVETHASLDLVVPRQARVIIEKVGGSAFLQDLESLLTIQKIGGDLALQRMGSVRLEKVGGGCMIEGLSDALTVHKIGGDLMVRQALGAVKIDSVGGNTDLQAAGTGALSARTGGDMSAYLTETLSEPVSLMAGGDLKIYVPGSINTTLCCDCGGETIELNLERQPEPIQQTVEKRRYELNIGENGPQSDLRAGGDIRISDESREPEPITGELERRENAWKGSRDRHGIHSWTGGFGFDRSSAWADMISRRAQEAARRAEQRAQAAGRRTEEQIRAAAEREMRRAEWRSGVPQPPMPPAPPKPSPVSEQERLMVLQMLKDGKLTIEQAESLLAALEGRFNR